MHTEIMQSGALENGPLNGRHKTRVAKLLYLTKVLPSPTAPEAGSKVAYNILEHLAAQHEIRVVSYVNEERELGRIGELPVTIDRVTTIAAPRWSKFANVLRHPNRSIITSVRYGQRFGREMSAQLRDWDPDIVWVEFTQMARYINDIKMAAPRAVTILYEHDVTTQMVTRRALHESGLRKLFWLREQRRLSVEEPALCNQYDLVCTLSAKDARLLVDLGVESPKVQRVVPFALRAEEQGVWADPGGSPPCLLFIGAMARYENVEAVRRLVRNILPMVTREFPDLRIKVVGGNSESIAQELGNVPGVRFTGFVPSIYRETLECHLAVFPLTLGAGVKIKVLEAMAWGMPVVTTPVGAEGTGAKSGIHLEDVESDDDIARTICELLRSPNRRSSLGNAARQLCQSEWNFHRDMKRLDSQIEWMLARRSEE